MVPAVNPTNVMSQARAAVKTNNWMQSGFKKVVDKTSACDSCKTFSISTASKPHYETSEVTAPMCDSPFVLIADGTCLYTPVCTLSPLLADVQCLAVSSSASPRNIFHFPADSNVERFTFSIQIRIPPGKRERQTH